MSEESKPKKTVPRKVVTKTATATVPRKRVATKKPLDVAEVTPVAEVAVEAAVKNESVGTAKTEPKSRYLFSTGRRKTAVANVRLYSGKGQSTVNRKAFDAYFSHGFLRDEVMQAFRFSGLGNQYYFVVTVHGGGIRAQAVAVRHGIATALATLSDEIRRVLKKNGLLTRDDRKKERKKPGLKRARRAPQWAKR